MIGHLFPLKQTFTKEIVISADARTRRKHKICIMGEKIAYSADEFSTDAFGEMLAIICK